MRPTARRSRPRRTVGAVGLIPDYSEAIGYAKMRAGDTLVLIGETHGQLGASLYLREGLGADGPRRDGWAPPPVDLVAEKRHGDLVRTLIREGRLHAVHDLSDGGPGRRGGGDGAGVRRWAWSFAPHPLIHAHGYLFGEDQARYLLATPDPHAVLERAREAGVAGQRRGPRGRRGLRLGQPVRHRPGRPQAGPRGLDCRASWTQPQPDPSRSKMVRRRFASIKG